MNIKIDNIQQKMMNILFSNEKNMFFYWNYSENAWEVFGEYIPEMICDRINPLEALLEKELLKPEYVEIFRIYLSQIESGFQSGLPEDYLMTQCPLKTKDGYQWYKIKCFFSKSSQNSIQEIAGFLEPMSSIDIMQNNQMLNLTMDRNPHVFADAIRDQFAKYPDDNFAFIQFDIEKFKMINELHGDAFGTAVLNNIVNTLKALCHEEQLFARLSSDLFMVVIRYNTEEDIVEFIRYLEKNLNHYQDVHYEMAFGVYLVGEKTFDTRHMGDSASLARKSIKGNALQNIAFYREDLKTSLYNRKFIEDNMKEALDSGQFVMYLQPQYSISTGKIVGAEALARWIHPEIGIIAPMDFIPVLEENMFVTKLDEYMWEQACRLIREWIDKGVTPIPISVNVSRINLSRTELLETLNHLLEKYDIPKNLLELEITETVPYINTNNVVRSLKEDGFTILMDDFGSGVSSLNTLKTTPFDIIKIDREFLNDFIESGRGKKIISHTIQMAKDIGLDLIAEGVETREQEVFLYNCGCNMAQGFYYSKPIPVPEFNKLFIR